jgi:thioredoxin-related protein
MEYPMKLRLLGILTAFSLLGLHGAARADVAWETDYQRASALARSSGKPLLIDVYTDWCGWCKKLDTDVYPTPRVQQLARSFVMLKLDAEGHDARYAQALKATGYPSLYFVSSQNRMLGNFSGYVDANSFAGEMQQALNREAELKQAAPSPKTKTTSRRQAAPATAQFPAMPPGPLDWRSQPDLRKLASQTNSGGVFLLDDTGSIPLDDRARKIVAKSKKSSTKTPQWKTKRRTR